MRFLREFFTKPSSSSLDSKQNKRMRVRTRSIPVVDG
jgi:hypothetical protein